MTLEAQRRGAAVNRDRAKRARLLAHEHGRELAAVGDPLHAAGCMLYWGEGSKERNSVIFTNSDAGMVAYFLRFLRSFYSFEPGRLAFSLNCHLHEGGPTLVEIEERWLRRLDLPRSALRKHTINTHSRASQRKRLTLPYGTGRLVLCSTFVIQSIYGSIQHYTGYDRPEWLDPAATRQMDGAGLEPATPSL